LDNKPFGKHVEGLSPYRHKSCADERKVQYDDFEIPSLLGIISRNPLLIKALRKFKSLHG
jgi:hypothetical protein